MTTALSTYSLIHNRRFFVVDDNPSNMFVITSLLQKFGGITAYERWGSTTIERMREFQPIDLILMDLMLPHTTGYALFDTIRALPEFADVPILAVSASDPAIEIPKARAKGFVGYIAKPIDYDRFADQIARVLRNEAVWVY